MSLKIDRDKNRFRQIVRGKIRENLRRYVHGLYTFDAVVQRAPVERLDRPTPCERWDGANLIEHNAFMTAMITDMARGLDVAVKGRPDDGLRPAPAGGDLRIAPRIRVPRIGDEVPAAFWNHHRNEVLDALDSPGAIRRVAMSIWGHLTVDEFLGFAFYDPLVHAWDLGVSVGVEPALDEQLALAALDSLEQEGDRLRQPRVLGEAVGSRSTGPVERLLAFTGRDPAAH